jgi:hypothetical protein
MPRNARRATGFDQGKLSLRDYQKAAVDVVDAAHERALIVAASSGTKFSRSNRGGHTDPATPLGP